MFIHATIDWSKNFGNIFQQKTQQSFSFSIHLFRFIATLEQFANQFSIYLGLNLKVVENIASMIVVVVEVHTVVNVIFIINTSNSTIVL